MIGFAFGIACLIGLKCALRGCRGSRCGAGWHGRRGRHGRSGFRGGPWSLRARLWDLLEHLDTSPGQEKVIRAEIGKLFEQAWSSKRALRHSGGAVARAMRGESLDPSAMDEAFAAQETALKELREAAMQALARIHEVLDPRQRELLAELLESGMFGGMPFGGPYRS